MYPFQNILFTTDFSLNSKSALKYAAAFARQHKAALYIHNAQEGSLPPQALKLSDRALSEHDYDWLIAVKKEMEEIADSEMLSGLKVQMVLTEGRAIDEIPRVIRDYKIDLATMGTTARTGMVRPFIGSTALGVMAQAECPVLLVRQLMHDFVFHKGPQTTIALNRILFAAGFTEFDISARQMAINLARAHQAQLIILHSVGIFLSYLRSVSLSETFDIETRIRTDAQKRLEQIAGEAQGVATELLIGEGRSYSEILRIANERDIDLIVMGTGRPEKASSKLLGSTPEHVVRAAPCPVLVVRHIATNV